MTADARDFRGHRFEVTGVRSTRATAALARLNSRSQGHHYTMGFTGSGDFILRERLDGLDKPLSDSLPLDDFVRLADSMGPKKTPRVTNYEAVFMRQLVKKDNAS